MSMTHTICPDCGEQFSGTDAETLYDTHMNQEHRPSRFTAPDDVMDRALMGSVTVLGKIRRPGTPLPVDREKLAYIITAAQQLDPNSRVIVGMKTIRAWESHLPAADAVIEYLEQEGF